MLKNNKMNETIASLMVKSYMKTIEKKDTKQSNL